MERSAALARAAAAGAAVLAADQGSKAIVRSQVAVGDVVQLPGPLDLVHVRNDGVAFGAFSGAGPLLLVIVAAAVAGLVILLLRRPGSGRSAVAIGIVIGGAVGNAIDRIASGAVTDFLKFPRWPAFNVADIAVSVGVLVLIWTLETGGRDRPEGSRE